MKVILFCIASLVFSLGAPAQTKKDTLVYVKHLEPPFRYPLIARLAQLQGTVILKLTISQEGKVLSAEASSNDSLLNQHPQLQSTSAELVKKWTFGCFNCSVDGNYEHVLKFVYRLEGEPKQNDDTRVVMDLPNEVFVTTTPPLCDHCPPPVKPKGKHVE
jgi:hypothetical protein